MRYPPKSRKGQKQSHLRQKKLSRAVHLAVLSMSVAPTIALADVQLDEGSGAAASALTAITNTATIAPAGDYLNMDGANTQLTGAITNSGTITAGTNAFVLTNNGNISGGTVNRGTILCKTFYYKIENTNNKTSIYR